MAQSESARVALGLDEFIALNDEVVALIRAGIPLEQGLTELGDDLPGRLGHVARDIAQRIQAGETLGHILMADDSAYPPLWRAVVGAGLRTGKLVTALEGISATARRLADMQRGIRAAMIYPWVVTTIAFALFVLLVTQLAPRFSVVYQDVTSHRNSFLEGLVWLQGNVQWWGILIPLAAITYWIFSSRHSRRAITETDGSTWRTWPGLRRAVRSGKMATFAETLALLLEHRVPLNEALLLSGDASGDRQIRNVARIIGQRLERGEIVSPREAQQIGFPPLLAWLLTNDGGTNLTRTLQQIAERCRLQAARETSSTMAWAPIAVTATFGGLVTLTIGIAIFWPISQMLYDLGRAS